MAGFAFLAFLPFMLVVLFMAGNAGHLQLVSIKVTFVATDALHFPVLEQQFVFGALVMIELDFLPAFLDMTGFTFRPEAAFMLVVLLVA